MNRKCRARCGRPVARVMQVRVPRIAFRAACLAMHNARNAATYIRNVSPPFFAFGPGPRSKLSGSAWESLKPRLCSFDSSTAAASFKTSKPGCRPGAVSLVDVNVCTGTTLLRVELSG